MLMILQLCSNTNTGLPPDVKIKQKNIYLLKCNTNYLQKYRKIFINRNPNYMI